MGSVELAKRRVLVNGAAGEIGRNFMHIARRRFWENGQHFEIAATNDLVDGAQTARMWRRETVYRGMDSDGINVEAHNGTILIDGKPIRHFQMREPDAAVYEDLGIDIVVDCTGINTSRKKAERHLQAGAKRFIVSAPFKDSDRGDITIVMGVNEHQLNGEHRVISNASCTTNSVAPLQRAISDEFGLVFAHLHTDHAFTNDQRLVASSHSDPRRSRRASTNIIPTTTGAAKTVALVLPELAGITDGFAVRTPIPNGSLSVVVGLTEKSMSDADMHLALRRAAEERPRIMRYSTREDLVSEDIVGASESSIIDGPFSVVLPCSRNRVSLQARRLLLDGIRDSIGNIDGIGEEDGKGLMKLMSGMLDGSFFRVLSWYDERGGYSNRLAELTEQVAQLPG